MTNLNEYKKQRQKFSIIQREVDKNKEYTVSYKDYKGQMPHVRVAMEQLAMSEEFISIELGDGTVVTKLVGELL